MAEGITRILAEYHEQTDPNTNLPYLINEDDFCKNTLYIVTNKSLFVNSFFLII